MFKAGSNICYSQRCPPPHGLLDATSGTLLQIRLRERESRSHYRVPFLRVQNILGAIVGDVAGRSYIPMGLLANSETNGHVMVLTHIRV